MVIKEFSTDSCAVMLSVKAKCNGKLIAITTNTIIIIKVEYFWFNLINFLLLFGNFLSKTLVIGVLKRERTPLKGVLKKCHSIFIMEWEQECHSIS